MGGARFALWRRRGKHGMLRRTLPGSMTMPDGRLYLGTRRYSSWSLRGWLAVRLAGLDVEEIVIPLAAGDAGGTPAVKAVSPSGLVPYLEHRGIPV